MKPILCFVTINITTEDEQWLRQQLQTKIDFVYTETVNNSEQLGTFYVVWDQLDSVLLINSQEPSLATRYQLKEETDKQDLFCQLDYVSSLSSANMSILDARRVHALYLNISSLRQLTQDMTDVLIQAIMHSMHDKLPLYILLDVPLKNSTGKIWSVQTERQWEEWQTLLCLLYMTQVQAAYSQQQPLFDMTVLILPLLDDPDMISVHLNINTLFMMRQHQDLPLFKSWNEKRQSFGLPLFNLYPLSAQSTSTEMSNDENSPDHQPAHIFERVVVGGTFDHLHVGHKILLTMTLLSSTKSVVIGVTDDAMLQSKKHKEWMETIDQRIGRVREFCKRIRQNISYEVVPIFDPYGPTITDPTMDVLVCSQETLKGGHMVNEERQKRQYKPLILRVINVISSASDTALDNVDNWADKISSTWIRYYLSQQKATQ